MSENDIEKTKQEIVKIDELIVKKQKEMNEPVSYTHLTLPTNREV